MYTQFRYSYWINSLVSQNRMLTNTDLPIRDSKDEYSLHT